MGILTQTNFDALINQAAHAADLAGSFGWLQGAGILTQANFDALINQTAHARALARGFVRLQQANILTPENRQALIQVALNGHGHAMGVAARSMILLNNNDQLTPDRLAKMVRKPRHEFVLALQDGEGFSRKDPVDNDVANLRKTLRVLGEGSRQDTPFAKMEPAILGKIGFFATCSTKHKNGIDRKTAAIMSRTLLDKPVVAAPAQRCCSIL